MKAQRGTILRSVGEPDRSIRFYLFHGPDDAGSRALAQRLLAALGAEKSAVSSSAISWRSSSHDAQTVLHAPNWKYGAAAIYPALLTCAEWPTPMLCN